MEIEGIKITKINVFVVFTGASYIFWNTWHGIVCIANRDYSKEVNEYDKHSAEFDIVVGNNSCLGGSLTDCTLIAAAKKYIRKKESINVDKEVKFTTSKKPLHHYQTDFKVIPSDD